MERKRKQHQSEAEREISLAPTGRQSRAAGRVSIEVMRASRPKKRKIMSTMLEICEEMGFDPGRFVIQVLQEADAVAEARGIPAEVAYRVKADLGKAVLNKIYPNKLDTRMDLSGQLSVESYLSALEAVEDSRTPADE